MSEEPTTPSAEETLVDIKKLLKQILDLLNRRIR